MADKTIVLSYKKLDVYRAAVDYAKMAVSISSTLPKGAAGLSDQLRRAAFSIPLNIAEGAGKPYPKDRRKSYAIARGSAMECGAVVDVIATLGAVDDAVLRSADALTERLVAMLTRMCV